MKSLRGLGAGPCLLWSEVPPASGKMVQRRAPPSPPRPCEALVTGGGGRSRSVNCVRDLGSPPPVTAGTACPGEARGEVSAPLQAVVFTSPVQGPLFPACLLSFPLETWKFSAVVLLLLCLPQGPGVLGRCSLSQRRRLRGAPNRRHVISEPPKRLLVSKRSDS